MADLAGTTGVPGASLSTSASVRPVGPTGVGNIEVQQIGHGRLVTPVQDREIPHFYISEPELVMIETGSGNADRTIFGLAVGVAVAFGIVDRTVKGLGPYNHALFVVGFWFFTVLALYSGFRAARARAAHKRICADVRKRPIDDATQGQPLPAERVPRQWHWPWSR